MLCMNNYPQEYIDECRARVASQLAAYRGLVVTAHQQTTDTHAVDTAVDTFAPIFFNNLVLVLDNLFIHRTRALEGKDGNPMNEVRVICNSLLNNKGKLLADKSIKLNAAKSVLGLQAGDAINLTEADFVRLSEAFFAAVETVFGMPEPSLN